MPGFNDGHHQRCCTLQRDTGSPMMKISGHNDSSPYPIPMALYAHNRQKLVQRLKQGVSAGDVDDDDDDCVSIARVTIIRHVCASLPACTQAPAKAIVLMEGGKEEYRHESGKSLLLLLLLLLAHHAVLRVMKMKRQLIISTYKHNIPIQTPRRSFGKRVPSCIFLVYVKHPFTVPSM